MNFFASYVSAEKQEEFARCMEALTAADPKKQADLFKFAQEFCYTFDARIERMGSGRVMVVTPNGLPIGAVHKAYDNKRSAVFRFTSVPIVQRDRALPGERHHEKYTRQGKTIAGLIRAIKKTDNPITETFLGVAMTQGLANGITGAYARYRHGSNGTAIRVPSNLLLAMTEALLGIDTYSILQDKHHLEQAHAAYVKANADKLAAQATARRFAKGSIAVGWSLNKPEFFYAAEVKLAQEPGKSLDLDFPHIELVTPLTRYEALPEVLGGKAIITKLYLQGIGDSDDRNPFGVRWGTDNYHEAVDVSCEYCRNTEGIQWVVIPKEEEAHVAQV